MANVIVLLILAAAVIFAIKYVIINGACGDGCSSCSFASSCSGKTKFDQLSDFEKLKHIKKMKEMQRNPEIQKALKKALEEQKNLGNYNAKF